MGERVGGARGGVARLLVGSVLISFSAVFVRLAHVPPSVSGFYRNLFGAIALAGLVAARRERVRASRRALGAALLAGVFFATDIFCWHRSILYVGPGLATILGNFQVFVLGIVGIAVLGERAGWRFVVSVPLALGGLLMLVGADPRALSPTDRAGVAYGLATAANYSAYLLVMRAAQRIPRGLGAVANLMVVSAVAALLLGASSTVEGRSLAIPDGRTAVVLATYGVVCQAAGWIVISRALPRVPASRAGLVLLLQPTLTFVWDILFFSRPTSRVEAAGAALALAAIYLGNTGRARPPASAADDDEHGRDATTP